MTSSSAGRHAVCAVIAGACRTDVPHLQRSGRGPGHERVVELFVPMHGSAESVQVPIRPFRVLIRVLRIDSEASARLYEGG